MIKKMPRLLAAVLLLASALRCTAGLRCAALLGRRETLRAAGALATSIVLARPQEARAGGAAAKHRIARDVVRRRAAREAKELKTSVFVGTYSDPNHPGGVREITLLDEWDGRFRKAEVKGGGGRGEPTNYVLPARIEAGDASIVIDFSPKGGPADFKGVWEEGDKGDGIRFVRDGNFWPQMERV